MKIDNYLLHKNQGLNCNRYPMNCRTTYDALSVFQLETEQGQALNKYAIENRESNLLIYRSIINVLGFDAIKLKNTPEHEFQF